MIIGANQMAEFEAKARKGYLDALVPVLKEGTGNHDVPDAEVRREIETVASQAEQLGLRRHEYVGLFIVVASDLGHDFWEVFAAAHEVLTSTSLDEHMKAMWLDRWHVSLTAEDVPPQPAQGGTGGIR